MVEKQKLEVCELCGNTHQEYPWLNGTCLFAVVQEACWTNGVVSDVSEQIAGTVITSLRLAALEANAKNPVFLAAQRIACIKSESHMLHVEFGVCRVCHSI